MLDSSGPVPTHLSSSISIYLALTSFHPLILFTPSYYSGSSFMPLRSWLYCMIRPLTEAHLIPIHHPGGHKRISFFPRSLWVPDSFSGRICGAQTNVNQFRLLLCFLERDTRDKNSITTSEVLGQRRRTTRRESENPSTYLSLTQSFTSFLVSGLALTTANRGTRTVWREGDSYASCYFLNKKRLLQYVGQAHEGSNLTLWHYEVQVKLLFQCLCRVL